MKHPGRKELRLVSQEEFVEDFVKKVDSWVDEIDHADNFRPAYTLVTGAGASRSAGIPLQGEMDRAIKSCLDKFYPNQEYDPPSAQEWEDSERLHFMACLSRANREPNLTHLIAADLASFGIFGPLLSTNFDDLMLAGFWGLPYRTSHAEPHVIYDVRGWTRRNLGLRNGVPLVIKVHGHHTSYWMARRHEQVRRLIPDVLRIYKKCTRPKYGFILVGYSGAWDDGVMAILRRKDFTRGLPIYWLVLDKPEPNERLGKIQRTGDLQFVKIQNSDDFFLRVWERLRDENPWLEDRILDTEDLFSPIPMSERVAYLHGATSQPKWNHGIVFREKIDNEEYWSLPAVKALQDTYLPILREIEEMDTNNLVHALLRSARHLENPLNRTVVAQPGEDDYSLNEARLGDRLDLLPSGIQWTRRNRALFRFAIGGSMGHFTSMTILQTLQELSSQSARIER